MKNLSNLKIKSVYISSIFTLFVSALFFSFGLTQVSALTIPPPNSPQSSDVGLEGEIPSPPPSTAATISSPSNSQTYSSSTITVTGLCTGNLLIEIFDNGIFVGSAYCNNNSYSITVTLFNGTNDLVAKDFDSLNQEGPVSSTTAVTYSNPANPSTPGITLTSNYAKIGQYPSNVLTWPISITNGTAPYAVNVNWGDQTPSELISDTTPGILDITHTYKQAGIYTVSIQVTDAVGNTAYLQVVGVANGTINQSSSPTSNKSTPSIGGVSLGNYIIWSLGGIAILLVPLAFWLGLRHQLQVLKRRLEKGERPFD